MHPKSQITFADKNESRDGRQPIKSPIGQMKRKSSTQAVYIPLWNAAPQFHPFQHFYFEFISAMVTANASSRPSELFNNDIEDNFVDDGLNIVRFATYFVSDVYPPILVAFGITGNLMSFLLLRQPQYRHLLTCFYMRALCVFDTIVMLCMVEFLLMRKVPGIMEHYGTFFCIHYIMVDYTAYSVSVWILAFFSIDRFIATKWPLNAAVVCTKKRAKVAISSTLCGFTLFYIPNFFRYYDSSGSTQVFQCPFALPPWFPKFFSITDTLLTVCAPFVVICSANAGIVITLFKRRLKRKQLGTTSDDSGARNAQIMAMLAVLTIAYIATNLPWLFYALLIEAYFRNYFSHELENLILLVVTHAMATNCAINFYMYCFSCMKFRKDLIRMIKDWFEINRNISSTLSTQST